MQEPQVFELFLVCSIGNMFLPFDSGQLLSLTYICWPDRVLLAFNLTFMACLFMSLFIGVPHELDARALPVLCIVCTDVFNTLIWGQLSYLTVNKL